MEAAAPGLSEKSETFAAASCDTRCYDSDDHNNDGNGCSDDNDDDGNGGSDGNDDDDDNGGKGGIDDNDNNHDDVHRLNIPSNKLAASNDPTFENAGFRGKTC